MKGVRLAFYGDDFTGSTDALEVLSYAGLKSALFLEPPSLSQLEAYGPLQAFGIAGNSRSLPTGEMEAELRPAFARFAELGIPLVHYKTCSTFDSAPDIGSIGRAIDIAQEELASPWVPLVVGAPPLQRFCVFGHLFARSGLDSDVFRLDRHPTMAQHPTTPMGESDLRLHLGRQTARPSGLFDLLQFEKDVAQQQSRLEQLLAGGDEIVLFDALYPAHLEAIGRLIYQDLPAAKTLFAAGSSGVEYALVAHWRRQGLLGPPPARPAGEKVAQTIVVSGSCSPVTARQIERAGEAGFVAIGVDGAALVDPGRRPGKIGALVDRGLAVLQEGKSVLFHTALGPQDPRLEQTTAAFAGGGLSGEGVKKQVAQVLGTALGEILSQVLQGAPLRRAVVAGGDTSAYAARQLQLQSLEVVCPLAPGSPLCRVRSQRGSIDGVEIAFKGGQVGRDDFFVQALNGGAS